MPHVKTLTFQERIIIAHDNRYKAIFDVVILFFVLYSCVTSMYYVAFETIDNKAVMILDEILEYIFWFDLLLNFLHSYIDPDTLKPVLELKEIAINYISPTRGWFLIDFISVFPFKEVFQGGNAGEITKLFRLFRLPRLWKLIDIQRFKNIVQQLSSGGESREQNIQMQYVMLYVYKIVRLIIMAIIITYFIGCFWWYFCTITRDNATDYKGFINHFALLEADVGKDR